MRSLLELKAPEAEKLFDELFSNSSVLMETGQFAAEKGNYGVALSLSILSAEELAKSIIIYLHGAGFHIFRITELQQIFYKHKRKHEFAILFEVLKVIEIFFPEERRKEQMKQKGRNSTGISFLDNVVSFLDQIGAILEPIVQLNDHIEWWDNADSMKNMGFYVDLKDGVAQSPTRVSKKEYDKANVIIHEFRNRFRIVKITLERNYLNKKSVIEDINKAIDSLNKKSPAHHKPAQDYS